MARPDHGPFVAKGLAFVRALSQTEESAFLALFAGARRSLKSFNGGAPSFGKAECEWVDDWRDFYGDRLAAAGLVYFEEGPERPALGMAPGSVVRDVEIGPTDLGWKVREAWWADWNWELDWQARHPALAEKLEALPRPLRQIARRAAWRRFP